MNEGDLRKFIEFTKTLLTQLHGNTDYAWFFKSFNLEVVNNFFQNTSYNNGLDKFQSITKSDIGRIKAYLNFIDKKAYNYGKVFYQNISDNNLKAELIKDFKEMKIALKNDDIIEFGRRLSLQLENIFNFSLNSLDVHALISANYQQYQSVTPNWPNYKGNPFNFYNSFFSITKNKNQYEPVELSRVSFNTKSIFLSIHFNYQVNARNIKDIYFLRNKGSHRDQLSQNDQQTLNRIISDFDKNYSFYHKVLFDVVYGIPNIR
ncbi:MAG: hypothetical protein GX957_00960 [Clostridiaceae bacterium]|nr:hypothetical protein [Clostridiaceae bacterium]